MLNSSFEKSLLDVSNTKKSSIKMYVIRAIEPDVSSYCFFILIPVQIAQLTFECIWSNCAPVYVLIPYMVFFAILCILGL